MEQTKLPKLAKPFSIWEKVMIGILIVMYLYYFFVAGQIHQMAHDSFNYLNNARLLLGEKELLYAATSPPLLSILIAPMLLLDGIFLGMGFIGAKLLMVIVSGALLYVTFLFLKLYFNRKMALFGTFLLSLNIIFIHHVPALFPDILSGFLLTVLFLVYLKARKEQSNRFLLLTSVLIFLSFLAKLPNGMIVFIIFAFEVFTRNWTFLKSKKFWITILLPFFLYYLAFSGAYTIAYGFNENSFIGVFRSVGGLALVNTNEEAIQTFYQVDWVDPWYEFIVEMYLGSSGLIMLLILGGLVIAFQKRTLFDKLSLMWFLGFFIPYLFLHRESRYMIAFFPPLYYFVMRACVFVKQYVARFSYKRFAWAVFMVLILVVPVLQGYQELRTFTEDEIYFNPFALSIIEYIDYIKEDGRVYFVDAGYLALPEKYILHEADEAMYMYTITDTHFKFYGRYDVPYYFPDQKSVYDNGVSLENPLHGYSDSMHILNRITEDDPLNHNDVLIFSGTHESYQTNLVPPDYSQQLYVVQVIKEDFRLDKSSDGCFHYVLDSGELENTDSIELCPLEGRTEITFSTERKGEYSLYTGSDDLEQELRYVGLFDLNTADRYNVHETIVSSENAEQGVTLVSLETKKIFDIRDGS
ncbi:MAG: hypothetical protein QF632_04070 [Candidatus Woesearchaeota archaeon]|jgi:hypothetical protein|nr:hypothetical protein [Candidatus Woesearchaeota archaeon]MDP7323908.1 hypothetical protein [Candidatus Woesearchaeota archaeon]MDP7457746.1 hypothetical protein [Candidatus Woesearchaeota archaeon]